MASTSQSDIIRLRCQVEQERLRYQNHLDQYQALVDATVEQIQETANTWTLSHHREACPDPALAAQLENEHNYMQDRYLSALEKLRQLERQAPTRV